VAYFALSGVNIIFPLWLQTTVGYTATWAGLAVAPVGLLALVAAPIVGRNMNRLNLRLAASFRVLRVRIRDFLDGDAQTTRELRPFWRRRDFCRDSALRFSSCR